MTRLPRRHVDGGIFRRIARARAADATGYSLVELITVMAILSVILGGIVALFTAGSNADADMNKRYRAQYNARLGLDRLRRDAHGACGLAAGNTSSLVTLESWDNTQSPATCTIPTFTWCTLGSGTRYALYRLSGAVACAAGPKFADWMTTANVFTFTPQNSHRDSSGNLVSADGTYTLARLHVDFPINLTPTKTTDAYRLVDDVAFRNSPRS